MLAVNDFCSIVLTKVATKTELLPCFVLFIYFQTKQDSGSYETNIPCIATLNLYIMQAPLISKMLSIVCSKVDPGLVYTFQGIHQWLIVEVPPTPKAVLHANRI